MRCRLLVTVSCMVLLVVSLRADGDEGNRFWSWGWGTYGGPTALDVARFDWSLINFGNVPADQRTVDRCNEILAINPDHKFVIRIWPIISAGDSNENRRAATFLHVYFRPEAREKVLDNTRKQIRLVLDGLDKPENVVGLTFLEELPGHFTAAPWRSWRPGKPQPWTVVHFNDEIVAELGEPFDMAKAEHRLWWGKAYAAALEHIHRAMKESSDNRTVIYWQATSWYTLDQLAEGEDIFTMGVVPIHYEQIVKPGVCDGLFGYPNNDYVWERQTKAMVEKLDCLMFSQLSTPAGMRLSEFDETVEMALWKDPRNLGTFLYSSATAGTRAWNELPYLDGSYFWSTADLSRRFAWERQIGNDIVKRHLQPQIALDYNATNKGPGDFIHVYGQVINPGDASWFGGDEELARMKGVRVTLQLPDGFELPLTNSPPATLPLGDIPPLHAKAGDWWVRVTGDGTIPNGQAFTLTAETADGARVQTASTELLAAVPSMRQQEIVRDGDTWVEPGYQLPAFDPAVELTPLHMDILFPELRMQDKRILWRDKLRTDSRLVIGPGYQARLFARPLVDEALRTLSTARGDQEFATFDDGYLVFSSPRLQVRPGANYTLTFTGKTSGESIFHAIVFFTGTQNRKPVEHSQSCFYNQLKSEVTSLEGLVTSPEGDDMTAIVRVYRHNKQGAIHLKSFDMKLADLPPEGLDVTDKLEGELPALARPFTEWSYHDRSDPDRFGRAKLQLRFFQPADRQAIALKERQGGDDF